MWILFDQKKKKKKEIIFILYFANFYSVLKNLFNIF